MDTPVLFVIAGGLCSVRIKLHVCYWHKSHHLNYSEIMVAASITVKSWWNEVYRQLLQFLQNMPIQNLKPVPPKTVSSDVTERLADLKLTRIKLSENRNIFAFFLARGARLSYTSPTVH